MNPALFTTWQPLTKDELADIATLPVFDRPARAALLDRLLTEHAAQAERVRELERENEALRAALKRAENVCEHGDHPAPDGKRFCSEACLRCEHESVSEDGCDGICEVAQRAKGTA